MAKKNQHIVPSPNGWGVRKENSTRLTKEFDRKQDAKDYGKEIAKNNHSELIVHNKDGKISEKNSYGNDPCPPKDKN